MQKMILLACLLPLLAGAQTKKPLTHAVYDGWKSVGERKISSNGAYILYTVNPQEGDGDLFVQPLQDTNAIISIPRGYDAVFSHNNEYVIAKIKPPFADTRQAKIKKKKPDEMPKDSLLILNLSNRNMEKWPRLKSFKMPEKSGNWLAYQTDSSLAESPKKMATRDTVAILAQISDSIIKKSLREVKGRISKPKVVEAANRAAKIIYRKAQKDEPLSADAEGDEKTPGTSTKAADLFVKNLATGDNKTFRSVADFYFDKNGNSIIFQTAKSGKDSVKKSLIAVQDLSTGATDTILNAVNDAKNFASDETGSQWAFVAERDSAEKSLQKFYKLWYFKTGADSARLLADKKAAGMRPGFTVSENANIIFSRDGKKLFFGVAPIQPPKDTTLVDFETARLDIWHYNDDYIQPQQLKQLPQESKRSFMAVTDPTGTGILQLGDTDAENVSIVDEGNADWVLAQSSKGNRVSASWEGRARNSAMLISTKSGERKSLGSSAYSFYQASPNGKYILWYDPEKKHYFSYEVRTAITRNITSSLPQPVYQVENDVPDFPPPVGIGGWMANDDFVLIEAFYDTWKVSPGLAATPVNITKLGKTNQWRFNPVITNPDKRFFTNSDSIIFTAQDISTKAWSLHVIKPNGTDAEMLVPPGQKSFTGILKARDAGAWLLQLSNIYSSELYTGSTPAVLQQITRIAQQQQDYNWLTAEMLRWKMFDGKMSEGILYKPENFDPSKKYPVIFYFYEKNTDGIFSYKAPAPSASTINIPYFVSNGYLVFDPNIYYKTGEPGESAYNSVVSAAKFLSKMPWVDSTRMGIQGQSWGGYQVAYLVTRTNMFKAAGAGAPVSNMTSAYGGIRWGSGLVRQFQYEKTQSRIGATLWQRPDLYLKNSPLFAADKINTPLLIMHNDADGAVPWYQGIELFAAMRRLGKKVWMLQYNGEDHNLVERRNRKDLSVRLSQFFDYYLKDAKPANWIIHGLPAVDKGRSWGLETE